jgi:hypothetical protein
MITKKIRKNVIQLVLALIIFMGCRKPGEVFPLIEKEAPLISEIITNGSVNNESIDSLVIIGSNFTEDCVVSLEKQEKSSFKQLQSNFKSSTLMVASLTDDVEDGEYSVIVENAKGKALSNIIITRIFEITDDLTDDNDNDCFIDLTEILLGTDPDNAESYPVDENNNCIADALENGEPTNSDDDPIIDSVPETIAYAGRTYTYTVTGHDSEQNPLTYYLLIGPNSYYCDYDECYYYTVDEVDTEDSTGDQIITWIPSIYDVGESVRVIIIGIAKNQKVVMQDFNIEVVEPEALKFGFKDVDGKANSILINGKTLNINSTGEISSNVHIDLDSSKRTIELSLNSDLKEIADFSYQYFDIGVEIGDFPLNTNGGRNLKFIIKDLKIEKDEEYEMIIDKSSSWLYYEVTMSDGTVISGRRYKEYNEDYYWYYDWQTNLTNIVINMDEIREFIEKQHYSYYPYEKLPLIDVEGTYSLRIITEGIDLYYLDPQNPASFLNKFSSDSMSVKTSSYGTYSVSGTSTNGKGIVVSE